MDKSKYLLLLRKSFDLLSIVFEPKNFVTKIIYGDKDG